MYFYCLCKCFELWLISRSTDLLTKFHGSQSFPIANRFIIHATSSNSKTDNCSVKEIKVWKNHQRKVSYLEIKLHNQFYLYVMFTVLFLANFLFDSLFRFDTPNFCFNCFSLRHFNFKYSNKSFMGHTCHVVMNSIFPLYGGVLGAGRQT